MKETVSQQQIKKKLTILGQIAYIKKLGVKFIDFPEEKAKNFLSNHTYFFKIKAYAKCFSKYKKTTHPLFGKYVNLDFNQLVELSRIDMAFRDAILHLTLDIEHSIRVELNTKISDSPIDDGYKNTKIFLTDNKDVKYKIKSILKHGETNPYTYDMIRKYKDSFAVWNLMEILSFSDLIRLYNFYKEILGLNEKVCSLLLYVKFARNAAAHANFMLNQLSGELRISPAKTLTSLYSLKIKKLSPSIKGNLSIPVIHDFTACIFVFQMTVKNRNAYDRGTESLKKLKAIIRQKRNLFVNELNITSGFDFIYEIIEFFCQRPAKFT